MLGLNPRTAFAIFTITIMLASVLATTPTAYAATYNFKLEATGQVRDRYGNIHAVHLQLTGTGYGSLIWLMLLRVESGTVTVGGLTFRIIGGWGTLIQRYNYISLYIRITPLYGGPIAGWYMSGRTGVYYAGEIPLTLSSRYIILPTYPRIILYNLRLTGEITLT
ncbi:MAG: hypothetical protein QXL46_00195 [Nitrososphaerales archaeon]